jgi:3-oxoacyl-[acyl-carrier-protein] synthase-3
MTATLRIVSTGLYLPTEVRDNTWWPEEIVERWQEKLGAVFPRVAQSVERITPGVEKTLDAIAALSHDPFQGSVERRIADPALPCSQMEASAAREALRRAGLDPGDVDILLSSALLPDYMAVNYSSIVHHAIGLRPSCLSLTVDAVCNSFFAQLAIADAMLKNGHGKTAVLTQSAAASRVFERDDPISALHGDAATAVVVQRTEDDVGLLSTRFYTDGSYHGAFVLGNCAGRWYDDVPVRAYAPDPPATRRMIVCAADLAAELIGSSLDAARLRTSDVAFYACHQPTSWFRRVTQAHSGLEHAKSADTFRFAGSVVGSNVPLQLAIAERESLVSKGDLLAMFGIASGMTACATLCRWG